MTLTQPKASVTGSATVPLGPVHPKGQHDLPTQTDSQPSKAPWGELFSFPNPVNDTSARIVAGGVVSMTAAAIFLDQPWLLFPLAYGFLARVLTGPKLSPLGRLSVDVITPRLPLEHKMVPGAPKRLAQGVGLAFSATALVLAYGFRRKHAAYAVLSGLLFAASLEAFFGICLVCKAFPFLVRVGVIREDACEECADLSKHFERLGLSDTAKPS
jgi:hypothetical protein